jgi:hypothetical protein
MAEHAVHGVDGSALPPEGAVLMAIDGGVGAAHDQAVAVASVLRGHGLASLLLEIAPAPDVDPMRVIARAAVGLLEQAPVGRMLPLGLMLSGSAATPGLRLVAGHPPLFAAIVVWGGALEVAADTLHRVHSPTLLIGGGNDGAVRRSQQAAWLHLAGPKRLEVVPDTVALQARAGALGTVAHLAADWFTCHLGRPLLH